MVCEFRLIPIAEAKKQKKELEREEETKPETFSTSEHFQIKQTSVIHRFLEVEHRINITTN